MLAPLDDDIRAIIHSLVLELEVLLPIIDTLFDALKVAIVLLHVQLLCARLPQSYEVVLLVLRGVQGVVNALLCRHLHRAVHHHIHLDLALNGTDLGGVFHENWFRTAAFVPSDASHQSRSRRAHHHLRLLGAHRLIVNCYGALPHHSVG